MASTYQAYGPPKFGGGAGGPNRFDFTQQWTGLYSQGIDINSPGWEEKVKSVYSSSPSGRKQAVDQWLAGKGYSSSNLGQLAAGMDWFYRDAARKIQQPSRFLGGFADKALQVAGPVVGLLTGNPLLGAAAGLFAGAPGEGYNWLRGAMGAASGGISGYYSPGYGPFAPASSSGGVTSFGNQIASSPTTAVTGQTGGATQFFTTPAAGAAGLGLSANALQLLKTAGQAIGSVLNPFNPSGQGQPNFGGAVVPWALPGALPGSSGSSGTGTQVISLPQWQADLQRLLGEQGGIGHKTRPSGYFNVLASLRPRGAIS